MPRYDSTPENFPGDPAQDQNFDWQTGKGGKVDKATLAAALDAFEIADADAPEKTAEEIADEAASRDFKPIPDGEQLLEVAGFLAPPKEERKEVYLGDRKVVYYSHSVEVRLCMASDRSATIIDFLILPPGDPNHLPAYMQGTSQPNGAAPGFWANKFYNFIGSIGFAYPPGGKMPAEARKLTNWIGRRAVATIQPKREDTQIDKATGQPKLNPKTGLPFNINPKTGMPYPPRKEVKICSYRPAEDGEGDEADEAPARRPAGNGAGNGAGNVGKAAAAGTLAQAPRPASAPAARRPAAVDSGIDSV